jgi:hypothetical protein
LLRNWAIRELASKYLHGQQVPRGQPAHVRELFSQVGGQTINDLGTPGRLFLALKDDLACMPIGFHDDGIRCQHGADSGMAEVALDLLQGACVADGEVGL